MKIQFLGAARTVTGSCFLVKGKWGNFLVDCGMFQGEEVEQRNYEGFDFKPENIDFVILTHSHLDHCGLLPKLYREGFRGKVYMTPPTRDIVENMLMDSAKVQEIKYKESKRANLRKDLDFVDSDEVGAGVLGILYDTPDVLGLLKQSVTINYGEEKSIAKNFKIKFLRVGHALGAASVKICVRAEKGKNFKELLFSGDIGNTKSLLDSRFDWPERANIVVMESLYGGKEHDARKSTVENFAEAINTTVNKNGNVLIPAFTYQRSQEVLFLLKRMLEDKRIPQNTKVYLDSPLAMKNLEVYKRHFRNLNKKIVARYDSGEALFSHPNFIYSRRAKDSKKINNTSRSIIIAGHGMCVGGRIRFHLMQNLEDKRAAVLFIGFQAPGTLGREIIDGAKEVFIDGRKLKVKARIVKLFGFSAHGDNQDLLDWIGGIEKKALDKVFLVHAEEETSKVFERKLERMDYDVVVPKWKQEIEI
jgi:metallo-beta-lactamase family protein